MSYYFCDYIFKKWGMGMVNNSLKFTLNIQQCRVFQYAEAVGHVRPGTGHSDPLLLSTFFFLLFLVGTLKCVKFLLP